MDEKIKIIEVREPRYQNVPMNKRDHDDLLMLLDRLGMGRRNQGAVLARLVRDELRRLDAKGLELDDVRRMMNTGA